MIAALASAFFIKTRMPASGNFELATYQLLNFPDKPTKGSVVFVFSILAFNFESYRCQPVKQSGILGEMSA